jgi:hypothetical protein
MNAQKEAPGRDEAEGKNAEMQNDVNNLQPNLGNANRKIPHANGYLTADQIAAGLEKQLGGKCQRLSAHSFQTRCPAHDDKNPSLTISQGSGIPLVHCHAGCDQRAVVEELKTRGLWFTERIEPRHRSHQPTTRESKEPEWSAVMPVPPEAGEPNLRELLSHRLQQPNSQIAETWAYFDARGHRLGMVVRVEHDGDKEILPITYCRGPNGQTDWRLLGFPKPRPLYGLDELAAHPDKPVLIVEGEKTTDAARMLLTDYCVVTWPGGTGAVQHVDWSPLRARHCTIWPDHDEPGQRASRTIAEKLQEVNAANIRIVTVPAELPEKWDLADVVTENIDIETLLADAPQVPKVQYAQKDNPQAQPQGTNGAGPRSLQLIHWEALEGRERPQYLVKGVLDAGRMSLLYGTPGSLKTFVALELAVHVARDQPWHGHRVRGGPVVYVACEGEGSIDIRLTAFCQHHGIERTGAPLYILPQAVNLGDVNGDVRRLIEELKKVGNVKLVIVDTLNRALFGGNENSPEDMGAFITACDAVREATGAHVLVIHHSGKDIERGARGHSALLGAIDTELLAAKSDGIATVRATKQRDMPEDFEIGFRWLEVEIGLDEDAEAITSLVLEPTDDRPTKKDSLPRAANTALDVLCKACTAEGEHPTADEAPGIAAHFNAITEERWRKLCDQAPLSQGNTDRAPRMAFQRARDTLIEANRVKVENGWAWWLPAKQANHARQTDHTDIHKWGHLF